MAWLNTSVRPDRRQFLRVAGAASVAVTGGCATLVRGFGSTIDFRNDFGVLNYALTLETLEATFYSRVVADPPSDLRAGELEALREIRDHEADHRDFFRSGLGPFAIGVPEVDFSSIDMGSRQGVLEAARIFEDLGVAAYNGAGSRLSLSEFLTIAGKIVSVEARHAATIRDMLAPNSRSFAGDDVIDLSGMDRAMAPDEVIAAAQPFFGNRLQVAGL